MAEGISPARVPRVESAGSGGSVSRTLLPEAGESVRADPEQLRFARWRRERRTNCEAETGRRLRRLRPVLTPEEKSRQLRSVWGLRKTPAVSAWLDKYAERIDAEILQGRADEHRIRKQLVQEECLGWLDLISSSETGCREASTAAVLNAEASGRGQIEDVEGAGRWMLELEEAEATAAVIPAAPEVTSVECAEEVHRERVDDAEAEAASLLVTQMAAEYPLEPPQGPLVCVTPTAVAAVSNEPSVSQTPLPCSVGLVSCCSSPATATVSVTGTTRSSAVSNLPSPVRAARRLARRVSDEVRHRFRIERDADQALSRLRDSCVSRAYLMRARAHRRSETKLTLAERERRCEVLRQEEGCRDTIRKELSDGIEWVAAYLKEAVVIAGRLAEEVAEGRGRVEKAERLARLVLGERTPTLRGFMTADEPILTARVAMSESEPLEDTERLHRAVLMKRALQAHPMKGAAFCALAEAAESDSRCGIAAAEELARGLVPAVVLRQLAARRCAVAAALAAATAECPSAELPSSPPPPVLPRSLSRPPPPRPAGRHWLRLTAVCDEESAARRKVVRAERRAALCFQTAASTHCLSEAGPAIGSAASTQPGPAEPKADGRPQPSAAQRTRPSGDENRLVAAAAAEPPAPPELRAPSVPPEELVRPPSVGVPPEELVRAPSVPPEELAASGALSEELRPPAAPPEEPPVPPEEIAEEVQPTDAPAPPTAPVAGTLRPRLAPAPPPARPAVQRRVFLTRKERAALATQPDAPFFSVMPS